jgi:hypothetical protein
MNLCKFSLKLALAITYLAVGSCSKGDNSAGSILPYGVYVHETGYVLVLQKSLDYQLCDAVSCEHGKWQYRIGDDGFYYVTISDFFKSALGRKMERDVVTFQAQGVNISYQDWKNDAHKFDYSHEISKQIRRFGQPDEDFRWTGLIGPCEGMRDVICASFGQRGLGIEKVGTFY